jgi:hypothetical protein
MIPAEMIAPALLGLLAGGGFGLLFFRLLALNTQLYTAGRVAAATGLHIGRLALAVGLFVLAARLGAVVLIASLAGFLVARPLILRRYGRA